MRMLTYIRCLYHALRIKADKRYRIPLTINLQVTNRCGNRCIYCSYDKEIPDLLTIDALKNIFSDIYSMGGIRINFTGGEPLMRPDLKEILLLCRSFGFFVSIATSGLSVEKNIEALKLADRVMLSFDGPDYIREELCGKYASQQTESAVLLFKKHSIPFWITTVLNRINIPYIDWIADYAKKNNTAANFVPLNIQQGAGLKFHPYLSEVSDIMPSADDYKRAISHIIDLKKRGAPIGSSYLCLEELLNWDDYTGLHSPAHSGYYICMAGRAFCELLSNGTLYVCGWSLNRQHGVSVLEKGFKDAFNSLEPLPDCNSCVSSCQLESNLIFNLNIPTLCNWVKKIRS